MVLADPRAGRQSIPSVGVTSSPRALDPPPGKLLLSKYTCDVRMKDRRTYRTHAELLKALAHESRLLIIDRLHRGECTVNTLVDLVGSDQSTVSKHLAVLRSNGVVEAERRGNSVVYRLLTPCVVDFLACASEVVQERRSKRR
jgi:ArsR family transcriptional regulator